MKATVMSTALQQLPAAQIKEHGCDENIVHSRAVIATTACVGLYVGFIDGQDLR